MERETPPRHLLEGLPESVIRLVRAMEGNRRRVAIDLGVSDIEFRALFQIAEAGSIVPKQLAGRLLVTTGAITGVSDRLVDAGLVQRTAHPADRRSLYLELTDRGHVEMARMHVELKAMLSQAAAHIEPELVISAAAVLSTIAEELNARVSEQ